MDTGTFTDDLTIMLPPEMVEEILLRTSIDDLPSMCSVNRRMSEICNEDFWKRRFMNDFSEDDRITKLTWKENWMISAFGILVILRPELQQDLAGESVYGDDLSAIGDVDFIEPDDLTSGELAVYEKILRRRAEKLIDDSNNSNIPKLKNDYFYT